MEKKRNLWVIPTDKPSRLMLRHRILFFFKDDDSIPKGTAKNQNIYITSDEEIKEGDWALDLCEDLGLKNQPFKVDKATLKFANQECEKIILTTDNEDLIKDGVQAINDEFLEWFVNNPSCEEVDVNKSYGGTYYITYPYKIIIPKEETKKEYQTCKCGSNWFNTTVDDKPFCFKCGESVKEDFKPTEKTCTCTDQCLGYLTKTCKRIEEEPKQEIVGYRLKPHIDRIMVDGILKNAMPIWNDKDKGKSVYFIRGHVAGSLVAKMKELQVLDLWFTPIYEFEEVKNDWLKQNHLDYYYKEGIMNNESKQETLEQIDQNNPVTRGSTALVYKQETLEEAKERYLDSPTPHSYRLAVEFGAKWQQERMYSEEDMRKAFEVGFSIGYERDVHAINENNRICKEWFEQFKKK